MNTLPASIEDYLRETGFSSTELLVLRKLFEENELTLRQLAAKTGKSTGVLDQATKKLLRRNIITRKTLNGASVYRLVSLAAIAAWVEEDTRQKHEMLKRRHQNFESFLQSFALDQKHPEMLCFDGEEGMRQAYRKLLEQGTEMLHYFPVVCAVEDDPLRDFRVEYFRERRRRGIFARCIVHNTPLGRRFSSRDPFEYRKTLPVPEDKYPILFEKVIAGDIVACFNHVEKRACFLRFPELAETERRLFERIWKEQTDLPGLPPKEASLAPAIPITTRAFSLLREFFLSRKSIALFALVAVVAAGITYGLYRQNVYLNTQRIRERAMSIAATGAMQFNAEDLEQLHTIEDITKPEYAKVIGKLNEIRSRNPGIKYMYILRPTSTPLTFEFVADADSIDPFRKHDYNEDGIINEADEDIPPGKSYDITDMEFLSKGKYMSPGSNPQSYTDQWGTWLSGYGPIVDAAGDTVAILAADIEAKEVGKLTGASIRWVLLFLGIFILFVFIRLTAFNKSLFTELWQVLQMRKVLITLALCAEIAFFITLGLYYYTLNIIREEMGQKLMAIVVTAASEFEPADLDQLRLPRDMKKEEYQRVFKKLNEIRDSSNNIKYVYLFRPTEYPAMLQFIADANANYYLPSWEDVNNNGTMDSNELNVAPGIYYDASGSIIFETGEALTKPLLDDIYTDQWGTFLSASVPISGRDGRVIALLGADIELSEIFHVQKQRFIFPLWFFGFFSLLVFARFLFIKTK